MGARITGNKIRRNRRICLALLIAQLCVAQNARADATSDFTLGVGEYRSGHPEAAARHFEAAERAGMRKPVVYFNLGLCYYRLGRDVMAREYFDRVRQWPDFVPLADYQLGLIAFREKNHEEALRQLDAAASLAPDLRDRVGIARERMTGTSHPRTSLYASGSLGYDSNATLGSDSGASSIESRADSFAEIVGVAQHRTSDWSYAGTIYYRRYRTENDFDQLAGTLDAAYSLAFHGWNASFGAGGGETMIGNRRFQDNLGPRVTVELGDSVGLRPRIRYQADRITTTSEFDYLAGWRHRLEASAAFEIGRAGYEFEFNRRHDLVQGSEFFSESPIRHRLFANLRLGSLAGVALDLSAQLKYSDFRRPNRFLVNGTIEEQRRQETLAWVGLQARLPQILGVRPIAEIRASQNSANIDDLRYRRIEALLGGEWVY